MSAFLDSLRLQIHSPHRDYGPFNGQQQRQTLFRALQHQFHFDALVETGTYRGATTRFLAAESTAPVHTVESSMRWYLSTRSRLRAVSNIHFTLADTRRFLRHLAANPNFPKRNIFFYLDAHWVIHDLPLRAELEIILSHWQSSIIMIDDFQVPDDAGYNFDSYAGTPLSLDYLRPFQSQDVAPFFPTAPSATETGSRRGYLILATDSPTAQICHSLPLLRAVPWHST